jgi:transglutaminase-like putative cysteine protease
VSRATPRRARGGSVLVPVLLFVGLAVIVTSFQTLLQGVSWWFVVVGVVAIVSAAMAVTHRVARRAFWPPIAGALAAVLALTAFFGGESAVLFVFPGPGTPAVFADLVAAGGESIQEQGIPAVATSGILFLFSLGFAAVTVLLDVLAVTLGRLALVGIPLLALVAVPSLIDPLVLQPQFFVIVAAVYLALIVGAEGRRYRRRAIAVGAGAVAVALVASIVLPPVFRDDNVSSQSTRYATGANPFVNLGDDLRRPEPVDALVYTTDVPLRQYFRLSVLEDFTGDQWAPTRFESGEDDFSRIGPAAGREDGAEVTPATASVRVAGNVGGQWLPVPYAATSIEGLAGDWFWDPDTLTVRSRSASIRSQQYVVEVDQATPSADQLDATGTRVDRVALARDLEIPADLDPIVEQTAREVVDEAGATTHFTMARALERWFRGSGFAYSTTAPVEEGYDGSSAAVIARFLEERSGYCVHFSAAMATMARTLGIPARIGVGYTFGDSARADDGRLEFTVSTDDLHAWPELYFDTIGWVRFEPTPGRGTPPVFGSLSDAPSTTSPTSTPTSTVTPRPTRTSTLGPDLPDEPAPGSAQAVTRTTAIAGAWVLGVLVVAFVLLLPAIIRSSRRSRRFARLRVGGAADAAWDEVRDTAIDLGLGWSEAETPRAFASRITRTIDVNARAALYRVLTAFEAQQFGAANVTVDPADLRFALRTLASEEESGVRWRARLAPASLLPRSGTRAHDETEG